MNYLVTGATGFVGRKLIAQLAARENSRICYLARKRSSHLPDSVTFQAWTTNQIPDLSSFPAPDVVFNLIGEPVSQRWTAAVKKRIFDSRIEATRSLVAALQSLSKRNIALVSASATGYYGDCGNESLPETCGPGHDFLADVCVAWEREATAARSTGLRVVPIRIAVVLGRDGGALPKMAAPFRFGLGAKFGNGQQWMSWIHVDDLVKLLLFAGDTQDVNSVLNGSSPQPVTNAQFAAALGRVLHRPAFLAVPRIALKLALGEMSEFLFASQRVIPEATERAGFHFTYPTLSQALKECLAPQAG